jgi:hypothetical protein
MDYRILYEGLEEVLDTVEFKRRAIPVEAAAFSKVILDTVAGRIRWKRTDAYKERYASEAEVVNASGKTIRVPVLFHTSYGDEDSCKTGYLQLFDENGPCRNTADSQVKDLATKHFKLNFKN